MSTLGQRTLTTSAGVRIGVLHIPRPPTPSGDALTLQRALLEPRTQQQPSLFARVFGRALQWL